MTWRGVAAAAAAAHLVSLRRASAPAVPRAVPFALPALVATRALLAVAISTPRAPTRLDVPVHVVSAVLALVPAAAHRGAGGPPRYCTATVVALHRPRSLAQLPQPAAQAEQPAGRASYSPPFFWLIASVAQRRNRCGAPRRRRGQGTAKRISQGAPLEKSRVIDFFDFGRGGGAGKGQRLESQPSWVRGKTRAEGRLGRRFCPAGSWVGPLQLPAGWVTKITKALL